MLKLENITKIYAKGSGNEVLALDNVSLTFRNREFVSILGPSGCGKTTMLNIIGGLDRYSTGDLIINGKSTYEYSQKDWDTYRNHSIGFVFQSYNLIPHLTILENVELALTIGGVKEKREKAKKALIEVGLEKKLNKKPTELSGGQNQRVSIARALVNEPDIILADEPTGALDTETSVQVMKILKEISKTRLVIMVTHNPELAREYSDRIVRMLDGKVQDDSNPLLDEEEETLKDERSYTKKYASMGVGMAFKLSGNNLLSKKRRTAITSIASSIGIMGVAIILSISNGMSNYINKTMAESTTFNYITVSSTVYDTSSWRENLSNDLERYPENTTGVIPYEIPQIITTSNQELSDEFVSYLNKSVKPLCVDIDYSYAVNLNILTKNEDNYVKCSTSNWNQVISNVDYVKDKYDILALAEGSSPIPEKVEELALVVDSYNRLSTRTLSQLGIAYTKELDEIPYETLIGKEFRVVTNNDWYTPEKMSDDFTMYKSTTIASYDEAYAKEGTIKARITSILREKEGVSASWLNTGLNYSTALSKRVIEINRTSDVALAQKDNTLINVTTGNPLSTTPTSSSSYGKVLQSLGYDPSPSSITIYPKDVDSKNEIVSLLESWNKVKLSEDESKTITYTDMSQTITGMLNSLVSVITMVLMFFSITSLIISSIMIAIVIYASVIERTKEIGILRSLGASKKDVGRIFEAEAVLIGTLSGIFAIVAAMGVDVIINIIVEATQGVASLAMMDPLTAIALIALSAFLLLIASLIPASIASKKEPAVALRTE